MKAEEHPDLLKGIVAGVAGGILASLLMEQFQAVWLKAAAALAPAESSSGDTEERTEESKPSTVKVADAIARRVTGSEVPKDKQEVAGEAVHYAMGGTSGAIYGALAEWTPLVTVGEGLGFGTAVWLAADEAILPALRFAPAPKETPVSTLVYALASHWVYGWVTEVVRAAVRRAL